MENEIFSKLVEADQNLRRAGELLNAANGLADELKRKAIADQLQRLNALAGLMETAKRAAFNLISDKVKV